MRKHEQNTSIFRTRSTIVLPIRWQGQPPDKSMWISTLHVKAVITTRLDECATDTAFVKNVHRYPCVITSATISCCVAAIHFVLFDGPVHLQVAALLQEGADLAFVESKYNFPFLPSMSFLPFFLNYFRPSVTFLPPSFHPSVTFLPLFLPSFLLL